MHRSKVVWTPNPGVSFPFASQSDEQASSSETKDAAALVDAADVGVAANTAASTAVADSVAADAAASANAEQAKAEAEAKARAEAEAQAAANAQKNAQTITETFAALKSSLLSEQTDSDRMRAQIESEISQNENMANDVRQQQFETEQQLAAQSQAQQLQQQQMPMGQPYANHAPGSSGPAGAAQPHGQYDQPPYQQAPAQVPNGQQQYQNAPAQVPNGQQQYQNAPAQVPNGQPPYQQPQAQWQNGLQQYQQAPAQGQYSQIVAPTPPQGPAAAQPPAQATQASQAPAAVVQPSGVPMRPEADIYVAPDASIPYLDGMMRFLNTKGLRVAQYNPVWAYKPSDIILIAYAPYPMPSSKTFVMSPDKRAVWNFLKSEFAARGVSL